VQSGDLIIVTGSENATAGQGWEIEDNGGLDESIVYLLDEFEEDLQPYDCARTGLVQQFYIL
jgi:hypothetical protein